jgi:hypothetical protein
MEEGGGKIRLSYSAGNLASTDGPVKWKI